MPDIKLPTDIEESLKLALDCMSLSRRLMEENGIECAAEDVNNWKARMGNVNNELGTFYQVC